MTLPTETTSNWSITKAAGKLTAGDRLRASVNLNKPSSGLEEIRVSGMSFHGELLRVLANADSTQAWPLPLSESYIRGNDLVASYQASPTWPFSPQVYWSVNPLSASGVVASVSILVSVQTHLLDTHPVISIESLVPSNETQILRYDSSERLASEMLSGDIQLSLTSNVTCLLHRFTDFPFSYAELIQSSDANRLAYALNSDRRRKCEWRLFSEFLEKGVIRRGRLFAAFLERANDIQTAQDLCALVERASLPLTT